MDEVDKRNLNEAPASRQLGDRLFQLIRTVGLFLGQVWLGAAGIVVLVSALGALAAVGWVLPIFGLGSWAAIFGLLALFLAVFVRARRRLLFVAAGAAILVPYVVNADPPNQVSPSVGMVEATPKVLSDISPAGYRSGLGEVFIDLRQLRLGANQTAAIEAGSDLNRTIVALPRGRCFNIELNWSVRSAPHLQRVIDGYIFQAPSSSRPDISPLSTAPRPQDTSEYTGPRRVTFYGRSHGPLISQSFRGRRSGSIIAKVPGEKAPTVVLSLSSVGGAITVRDYPDKIGPLGDTASGQPASNWPAYVTIPHRPERGEFGAPDGAPAKKAWSEFRKKRSEFNKIYPQLVNGHCNYRTEW